RCQHSHALVLIALEVAYQFPWVPFLALLGSAK
ncbi:MAG: hypothetical protein RLZZ200_647, partial [Pseudomonadota bacterium]